MRGDRQTPITVGHGRIPGWVRLWPLLFTVVCVTGTLRAQGTGSLQVHVVDSSGEPLPGVTITLSHDAGNVKTFASRTDTRGCAEFPVLRPGPGYTVEALLAGFGARREADIRVPIGDVHQVKIQLAEEMREHVRVVATREVVDLDTTATTTRFSDEFIQGLPVPGRFYQHILPMAPGVQDPDGDGNPTVHGSRSRDFKTSVNGVSNVNPLTGRFMGLVNSDSIEEIEIITGGAGVEFGRAQGGFARIMQKQGSNELEGSFGILFRSSRLDGAGAGDTSNLPDPEFDTYQPSFQLTGPVIKDRLWYRLSHEFIDREDPVNVVGSLVVQTTEQQIHSDQLTWQVSPRNKLAFAYQADPLARDNVGVSSSTPSSATARLQTEAETWSLSWTTPYNPRLLAETVVSWQDRKQTRSPTLPGQPNRCVVGNPFLEDAQCFNVVTGEISGSYPIESVDHSQRLTLDARATYDPGKLWGVRQRFNFGFVVENERHDSRMLRRPDLRFAVLNTVGDAEAGGTPEELFVIDARISVPQFNDVRATATNWSAWLENRIKPAAGLVVTVGARVDREEIHATGMAPFSPTEEAAEFSRTLAGPDGIPGTDDDPQLDAAFRRSFTAYEGVRDFARGVASILGVGESELKSSLANVLRQSEFWDRKRSAENIDLANTNLGPYLSVSWDPWRTGDNKFAASARRHFQTIFLAVPLLESNPASTNITYRATSVGGGRVRSQGLNDTIHPTVNIEMVDRDLKTPHTDEYRLVYERGLSRETLLRIEYNRRKYRDQLQNVDLNRRAGDYGRCRLADSQNPDPLAESPGSGFEIVDPYTGATYIDSDPGPGDGQLDDCTGQFTVTVPQDGTAPVRLGEPDGFPDLYTQNPGWGGLLAVGNHNQSDYEGVVLQVIRRHFRGWQMSGSYTWSISEGNGEDFRQFNIGLDPTLLDDEFGYQSSDQRHVAKVHAMTITPWGFRLGGSATWQSGLPYSIIREGVSFPSVPPAYRNLGSYSPSQVRQRYPTGRRNSGRNDSQWLFDLMLTKESNLGRRGQIQLSAEVFNVLNDNTYEIYSPDTEQGLQVNGKNLARREFGRRWQLGMKLTF